MGKKLLLADDSVTIQKVVGISFANEDVELITVDNGDDAVTRARAERPDVVLADVVMPGMNGYEVCEALKSDADLAHVPVLLLTGTFEAFDEARAAACGAAGHIAKPFEAQVLVDRVRELLSAPPAAPAEPVAIADDDGATIAIGRLGVDPSGGPAAPTPAAASAAAADSFDFFDDAIAAEPASAGAATTLDLDPEENVFAFADALAEPAAASPAAPATPVPDFGSLGAAVAAESEPPVAPLDDPAAEPMSDLLAESADDILAAPLTDSLDDPMAGTQLMSEELIADEMPPSFASADDIALGLDASSEPSDETLAQLISGESESADLFAIAADEVDPLLGDQLGQETILDPQGASGYDVSGTDLLADDATNPDPAEDSSWGVVEGTMPPVGGAAPDPSTPRPLAGMPPVTLEPPGGDTLDAAAVATLMDESSLEEVAFAEAAPDFAIGEDASAAVEMPSAEDDDLADFSDLSDPLESEERRVSTSHDPAALAGIAMAEIEPQLREQLHDTLEKIAWENLGAVTEQIINQAVERIERAAWEVIPEMAETLIREEIRKMKGE